jgi:hypothetical protein
MEVEEEPKEIHTEEKPTEKKGKKGERNNR